MGHNLRVFENSEFGKLRVVEIDGGIYFVGKEVAKILGYKHPHATIRYNVSEEDKRLDKIPSYCGYNVATVINGNGLYSLILSSKLPTAEKFKRWVADEVLPSIRGRGACATESFAEHAIKNPAWGIEVLTAFKELQEKNRLLEKQIAELTPKANCYDSILKCIDRVDG